MVCLSKIMVHFYIKVNCKHGSNEYNQDKSTKSVKAQAN